MSGEAWTPKNDNNSNKKKANMLVLLLLLSFSLQHSWNSIDWLDIG